MQKKFGNDRLDAIQLWRGESFGIRSAGARLDE
jgi:hypothetical protein